MTAPKKRKKNEGFAPPFTYLHAHARLFEIFPCEAVPVVLASLVGVREHPGSSKKDSSVSQQNEGKRCQSEDTQERKKKRRQQARFERVSIDSSSSKKARSPPVGFFDEVKRPLFATCSDTKGQEEVEEVSHEGPSQQTSHIVATLQKASRGGGGGGRERAFFSAAAILRRLLPHLCLDGLRAQASGRPR